jgi:hypothetical protein
MRKRVRKSIKLKDLGTEKCIYGRASHLFSAVCFAATEAKRQRVQKRLKLRDLGLYRNEIPVPTASKSHRKRLRAPAYSKAQQVPYHKSYAGSRKNLLVVRPSSGEPVQEPSGSARTENTPRGKKKENSLDTHRPSHERSEPAATRDSASHL